jgi:transposase
MEKSGRNFSTVTRVGLDLAKRVFQVHAVSARRGDRGGAQAHAQPAHFVFRRAAAVRGGNGAVRLGASLGRALIALGHEVRLLPPAHVKPYVRRNKNDAVDAAARARFDAEAHVGS